MARRRWVPIVFGVAVLLVFIGIGAAIAITAWFQQNVQVETRPASEATSEFEAIRKRFEGRPALLQIRDGRPEYALSREAREARGQSKDSTARLETLHVLAWDERDGQLARVSLPFWVLRMKSDPIRLGSYASGLDDGGVDLRPSDIEQYGPGIILDTGVPAGGRVLVWAQ
jgi:hypothetical protein